MLGENIRLLRIEKGLSQSDLASKAGISRESIVKYERGKRQPTIDIAINIADALEVPLDIFVSKIDIKSKNGGFRKMSEHESEHENEVCPHCGKRIADSDAQKPSFVPLKASSADALFQGIYESLKRHYQQANYDIGEEAIPPKEQ